MVADHRQFELRPEFKEILPHEPGGNHVAARKLLDANLSPGATFFGFRRTHHPSAFEHREVGRGEVRSEIRALGPTD